MISTSFVTRSETVGRQTPSSSGSFRTERLDYNKRTAFAGHDTHFSAYDIARRVPAVGLQKSGRNNNNTSDTCANRFVACTHVIQAVTGLFDKLSSSITTCFTRFFCFFNILLQHNYYNASECLFYFQDSIVKKL